MYEIHNELVESKACVKWTLNNANGFQLLKTLKSNEFLLTDIRKSCFFVYNRNVLGGYYEVYLEYCDEIINSTTSAYLVTLGGKIPLTATFEWKDKLYSSYKKYYYNAFNEPAGESNAREFCFEIRYLKNINTVKLHSQKMIPSLYDKFWKNQELCDVEFLINEAKIKAHAIVLAAASPYFLAMFNNKDTVESINRVVDLSKDDVTLENFQGFLEFIYGCKNIDELSSLVHDLFVLADKYNVEQLHQACQQHMSNIITKENVTKMLLLSDKYNGQVLKMNAINFAKANIDTVKNSDDFDALCKITGVMRFLL